MRGGMNLKHKKKMKYIKLLSIAALAWTANTAYGQEGAWKGELNFQGNKLPLVFHFSADNCTFDSPSQGAKGIPAEKSVGADSTIQIKVPAIGAIYVGQKKGQTITGSFSQNGFSLPLLLTPGVYQVSRPQTPVPPYPYKEEQVSFNNDGFTFSGTLTLPANCDKKTPVVLMVTGSGLQNRDEELVDHKPFAVIADALARQGIASLRYDDRGYGVEGYKMDLFTTADFKQDAEAALKLLRKRFGKVGILGHSEGGTIALMLAAENKADFVVSLAGMVLSGKETLISQNRKNMEMMGLPKETLDNYCAAVQKMLEDLASGKKLDELNFGNVPQELKPVLTQSIKQCDSPYFRYLLNLDIRKDLGKIKCPVLALNGTKDCQVECDANLQAIETGLSHCAHKTQAFSGLNHLFQHCETGNVIEYQQIEETLSPEVLNTIISWLKTL